MKSYWPIPLTLILTAPALALAQAERVRDARPQVEEGPTILSISIDGQEARGVVRLRDTLRQPLDDMNVGAQPYRLSVEERQRLREQLRGQSAYEDLRKQ